MESRKKHMGGKREIAPSGKVHPISPPFPPKNGRVETRTGKEVVIPQRVVENIKRWRRGPGGRGLGWERGRGEGARGEGWWFRWFRWFRSYRWDSRVGQRKFATKCSKWSHFVCKGPPIRAPLYFGATTDDECSAGTV